MTANWKVVRTTILWLLVAVMTMAIVVASPYVVKSEAASAKKAAVSVVKLKNGKWAATRNGKVDTSVTGIYKNKYGWWRVNKGYVDFKANGVYKNDYGWFKTTNGKVTFKETGLFKNEYGWWRVEDSKVNFKANGVYQGAGGAWFKTTNGKVTWKENGIFKNKYGYWKVENSKVNFGFTGVASNDSGDWWLEGGKVRFDVSGEKTYNGTKYIVFSGRAYEDEYITALANEIKAGLDKLAKEEGIYSSRQLAIFSTTDDEDFYLKEDVVTAAVDRMGMNWKNQALLEASDILGDWDAKEYNGISEQLFLEFMDEVYMFTKDEIDYAANIVKTEANKDGGYWKEQCRAAAKALKDGMAQDGKTMTKADLTEYLTEMEFTKNQVTNVVNEYFPS